MSSNIKSLQVTNTDPYIIFSKNKASAQFATKPNELIDPNSEYPNKGIVLHGVILKTDVKIEDMQVEVLFGRISNRYKDVILLAEKQFTKTNFGVEIKVEKFYPQYENEGWNDLHIMLVSNSGASFIAEIVYEIVPQDPFNNDIPIFFSPTMNNVELGKVPSATIFPTKGIVLEKIELVTQNGLNDLELIISVGTRENKEERKRIILSTFIYRQDESFYSIDLYGFFPQIENGEWQNVIIELISKSKSDYRGRLYYHSIYNNR